MYPPGSQGFPRLSPSPGVNVAGYWVPEGVSPVYGVIIHIILNRAGQANQAETILLL